MNPKRVVSVAALTAVGLGIALWAAACGRSHHGHFDPERLDRLVTWKLDDAMDELKATGAQRKQLLAIKDRVLARLQEERLAHQADKGEWMTELVKDQPDADRLHRLLDQRLDELRPKLHEALDVVLEVHAVLTPEQRAEIQKRIAEHHRGLACPGER